MIDALFNLARQGWFKTFDGACQGRLALIEDVFGIALHQAQLGRKRVHALVLGDRFGPQPDEVDVSHADDGGIRRPRWILELAVDGLGCFPKCGQAADVIGINRIVQTTQHLAQEGADAFMRQLVQRPPLGVTDREFVALELPRHALDQAFDIPKGLPGLFIADDDLTAVKTRAELVDAFGAGAPDAGDPQAAIKPDCAGFVGQRAVAVRNIQPGIGLAVDKRGGLALHVPAQVATAFVGGFGHGYFDLEPALFP